MFGISFTVEGDIQLQRMLAVEIPQAIKREMGDFYDEAGTLVVKRSESIFASSGSNVETGEKWAKLAPSTIQAKRRRGESLKPLVASGNLSKGTEHTVSKLGVTISNKHMEAYGKFHQSSAPRTKLPRRLFLELDQATRSNIIRLLQVRIHNAINPTRATRTRLK